MSAHGNRHLGGDAGIQPAGVDLVVHKFRRLQQQHELAVSKEAVVSYEQTADGLRAT